MLSLFASLLLLFAPIAHAQTPSDVQAQIDTNTTQIQQLQAEIAQLQKQLDATSKQKQTLQNAINEIALNIKKINTTITLTNAQIVQKDKEINRLSGSISTTTDEIGVVADEIGSSLQQLNMLDNEPLALVILSGADISSVFDTENALESIRSGLQNRTTELQHLKSNLVSTKNTTTQQRAQLATLKQNLAQQKTSLGLAQQSQTQLLAQTKNQESSYQALIAQKKAEEAAFEAELVKLAQGLGTADVSSAAAARRGILKWPLDNVAITQYFGNTSFAQSGAYSGQGHNGIDFRAPIGTPIKTALTGTVQEINLGAVKNCQYGKWVLIKHDNGLTSLYAHLSSITVNKGDRVLTGQVIGYAGDTGYATGPHLHLTVYVSSAVSFKTYTCNSGKTAYIPIAPLNAYLNPLSYLP
ncbi:peptidoglycan DD-metalloendopeptidase family protein [Patescibacteria group bacterium]|nr:peptidoglycan DD-metalloendopeptidase family protein [Patescibacteria group bacterium]